VIDASAHERGAYGSQIWRAAEPEEQQRLDDQRVAEERRLDEQRVAEEQRRTEELRGLEEQRNGEPRRKSEERRRSPAGSIEVRNQINAFDIPHKSSGLGVLTVTAFPFGQVLLNGRNYGTTPREFLLAKGTYRVRATHPTLGEREKWIDVSAGGRVRWTVDFDDSKR
jgi:hypothetical protein